MVLVGVRTLCHLLVMVPKLLFGFQELAVECLLLVLVVLTSDVLAFVHEELVFGVFTDYVVGFVSFGVLLDLVFVLVLSHHAL